MYNEHLIYHKEKQSNKLRYSEGRAQIKIKKSKNQIPPLSEGIVLMPQPVNPGSAPKLPIDGINQILINQTSPVSTQNKDWK